MSAEICKVCIYTESQRLRRTAPTCSGGLTLFPFTAQADIFIFAFYSASALRLSPPSPKNNRDAHAGFSPTERIREFVRIFITNGAKMLAFGMGICYNKQADFEAALWSSG